MSWPIIFQNRDLPQAVHFSFIPAFAQWTQSYAGKKYIAELEANEFAGRLLIPNSKLESMLEEFARQAEQLIPQYMWRKSLCEQL